MLVPAHRVRTAAAIAVLAAMAAAGCSSKQTSPAQLCDNGGMDLIAFASDRNHHGQFDVYLYDINGLGYRLLRNLNSSVATDSSPVLSPDILLLAFVTSRGATGSDILLYDRGSCGFVDDAAVNSAGDESQPAFSGDISRLLFVRDTLGHRRIRAATASAGTIRLVPLPVLDSLAAWDDWSPAPDLTGKGVIFVSNREGPTRLYFYDRDSLRIDPLTALRDSSGIGADVDPTFTPDRRFVCFASNRPGGQGGYDLYLYDFSHRHYVSLPSGVNTSGDEEHPSLNQAGTLLAYQGRTSPAAPWSVHYCVIASGAGISTIGRIDSTASDVQPSIVFP